MLKSLSEESKKDFIKSFTEELIINSKKDKFGKDKIKEIIEEHDKTKLEKYTEEVFSDEYEDKLFPSIVHERMPTKRLLLKKPKKERKQRKNLGKTKKSILKKLSSLLSPKDENPKPFQYSRLKPTPSNKILNLGKLNPYIKDPTITSIECKGPNQNIIVHRLNETRSTNISLNKSEIKNILKLFSREAKIPLENGPFQIAVGVLSISGINSEIRSSPKFIISKIYYNK